MKTYRICVWFKYSESLHIVDQLNGIASYSEAEKKVERSVEAGHWAKRKFFPEEQRKSREERVQSSIFIPYEQIAQFTIEAEN